MYLKTHDKTFFVLKWDSNPSIRRTWQIKGKIGTKGSWNQITPEICIFISQRGIFWIFLWIDRYSNSFCWKLGEAGRMSAACLSRVYFLLNRVLKRLCIWNGGDRKCVIWLNVSFCGLLLVNFLSLSFSYSYVIHKYILNTLYVNKYTGGKSNIHPSYVGCFSFSFLNSYSICMWLLWAVSLHYCMDFWGV